MTDTHRTTSMVVGSKARSVAHAAWLVLPGAAFFIWGARGWDPLAFLWIAGTHLAVSLFLIAEHVLKERLDVMEDCQRSYLDHYFVLLGLVSYLNFVGPAALALMRTMAHG